MGGSSFGFHFAIGTSSQRPPETSAPNLGFSHRRTLQHSGHSQTVLPICAKVTGSSHVVFKMPWVGGWSAKEGKEDMPNLDHYTYRVSWSEEDGELVGTCVELASRS